MVVNQISDKIFSITLERVNGFRWIQLNCMQNKLENMLGRKFNFMRSTLIKIIAGKMLSQCNRQNYI